MMTDNKELLTTLQAYIEEFDIIFLVWKKGKAVKDQIRQLCGSQAVKHTKKKILLLSVLDSHKNAETDTVTCRHISETEAKSLFKLYSLYEFSDRFRIFPETGVYGNLFNFFDTGVLCLEDIWEAYIQ